MLIMALMAAVQWDALALDERDAAILGPLPVDTRDIGRAKLSALVIFVTAFAVLLNGVPSLLFPLLTVSHFHVNIVVRRADDHRPCRGHDGGRRLCVSDDPAASRAVCACVLGPRWFGQRISALVQAALIIALGTTLLLLPAIASNVPARWLGSGDTLHAVPPAWFLGLYEAGTGQRDPDDSRTRRCAFQRGSWCRNATPGRLYDALLPRFPTARAGCDVGAAGDDRDAALALYLWNNRRLPTARVSHQRPHSAA